MGLSSKPQLHLLSDPSGPIAYTMKLGLASGSRFQGAHRQPLSRFAPTAQGCSKDRGHRTRLMHQTQASFPPAQFACLSTIPRPFCCSRLCRFHHRYHASVHLGNEHGHPRSLRQIASGLLPRPHGLPMFFRKGADGTYRNFDPIVLAQFGCGSGKGVIGPKIGEGSLQSFGTPTALYFRRLGKRSHLRSPTTLREYLLRYFDFSPPRVPVEAFFSFRLMPGLALYSSSFFRC